MLDSYEESVLAWLGTWFLKQVPAYERATELFEFANAELQLDLLDSVARLSVLLEHPGVHTQPWDDYVKQQTCSRGYSVKAG